MGESTDDSEKSFEIYAMEEPDLWRSKKIEEAKFSSPRDIRFVEYQQSDLSNRLV